MGLISAKEENLIRQYAAICNAALLIHAHRFPYKQILEAAEKTGIDRKVEARMFGDPKHSFVLALQRGRIQITPHDECRDCKCDYQWTIPMEYLQDVVRNPERYISNPAKLDWDWLYKKS